MSTLPRAIAMVLGTLAVAASANAATYVVTAKLQNFDAQLARKIEAAGGTISARLPQIGVAIVESADAGFAARAAKTQGIRSVVTDYVIQFDVPEAHQVADEDFTNPPTSGDDDTFFDLQWGSAAVDVAGAWNQGYRGNGAIVAVLDSGVVCGHIDIAANLLPDSTSFVANENVCHNIPNTLQPWHPRRRHRRRARQCQRHDRRCPPGQDPRGEGAVRHNRQRQLQRHHPGHRLRRRPRCRRHQHEPGRARRPAGQRPRGR